MLHDFQSRIGTILSDISPGPCCIPYDLDVGIVNLLTGLQALPSWESFEGLQFQTIIKNSKNGLKSL